MSTDMTPEEKRAFNNGLQVAADRLRSRVKTERQYAALHTRQKQDFKARQCVHVASVLTIEADSLEGMKKP